ncbi:MAG: glycoside hydrolase family 3 C-terminal domain-containing protein, partial [Candidatus Promineifilaceae bacterium]
GSAQVNAHYRITPYDGILNKVDKTIQLGYEIGCTNHKILSPLGSSLVERAGGEVGDGFTIAYFNSLDLSGEPAHQAIGAGSEQMWLGEVADGVDPAAFSVRLSATFKPEETGEHIFGLSSAGLSRFYVDGQEVIDNWDQQISGDTYFGMGSTEQVVQVEMIAGQSYELAVEYSKQGTSLIAGFRLGYLPPVAENAIERAVELAAGSDVALVFVGLNGDWESEGHDRPDMELVGDQVALIKAVAATNPRTVVVLQTGSPVSMPWLDKVAGVIQAWYPGQECGNAIADVLFGDSDPSGKLPQTFPARLEDNPAFINYPGENGRVTYGEGIFVGYRYYEKKKIAPLFPFGFGLSYTNFAYDNLRLNTKELSPDDQLEVAVDVTNAGERAGKEIVQLYVCDATSSLVRPEKELKGFVKVALAPGETKAVRLTLDRTSLAYWDDAKRSWVAEAGDFEVLVGSSSQDIRARTTFALIDTVEFDGPTKPRVVLTINNSIKELLENDEARAVLEKHAPGFSKNPQLGMALGFSPVQLAAMAPDQFPEKVLQDISDDLVVLFPPVGEELAADDGDAIGTGGDPRFTLDSPLEQLLADEDAKAVLEKHFPGMLDNPQLQMAMGMSLQQVAPIAQDVFSKDKLAAVASDLARLD